MRLLSLVRRFEIQVGDLINSAIECILVRQHLGMQLRTQVRDLINSGSKTVGLQGHRRIPKKKREQTILLRASPP